MSLADPITVAANSPNPELKLAVISQVGFQTERLDTNDGGYRTIINHTKTKTGSRHYLQIMKEVTANDPVSGLPRTYTGSVSLTINRPLAGFTVAQMDNLVTAFKDTLTDSEVTAVRLLQFQG